MGSEKGLAAGQIVDEWSRRLEIRAESFLHAIPDLMFLIRRDGTYLDYQPTKDFQPYLPPEQFLGKQVMEIMPEPVAAPSQYLIDQAIVTRQMQCLRYSLTIHGIVHNYEARIVPKESDQVLAIVRDNTGLDPPLSASQVSAHFRARFENSTEAIAVTQSETVIFANSAMANMFGYPSAENLTGCCIFDLIAEESWVGMELLLHSGQMIQPLLSVCCGLGRRRSSTTFNLEIRQSVHVHAGEIYAALQFRDLSHGEQTAERKLNLSLDAAAVPAAESARIQSLDGCALTAREVQVLMMIANGQSTKQVAGALGVAYKTVDVHRTNLMKKLGLHDVASLVRYAVRAGLVKP